MTEQQTNGRTGESSGNIPIPQIQAPLPLRESDAALARWLGASAGEEIRTDLYPSNAWRVDLYRVGTVFGRLTVDIDRNGIVEEEWTLEDGKVQRVVHPRTNEEEHYEMIDSQWHRSQ